MNVRQFKELILIPALQAINLYSDDAVSLLLATLCQESNFCEYVSQQGSDIAKGVFQMEDRTYVDIFSNYLVYHLPLRLKILSACGFQSMPPARELISNLKFACMMARVFYLRCPGELPDANDIEGIWNYYKLHYNTPLGKATKEEFMAKHKKFLD